MTETRSIDPKSLERPTLYNLITGEEFPREVDEFVEARLTPIPSEIVRPPRIAEAAVAMECQVREIHPLPAGSRNTLVIGEIMRFHVREDLIGENLLVDTLALDPISRLARKDFAVLDRVVDGKALMDTFRAEHSSARQG